MISWVRLLRANKQAFGLFCLIVSFPLVEHTYMQHQDVIIRIRDNVQVAVNFRQTRQLSFQQEERGAANTTARGTGNQVTLGMVMS